MGSIISASTILLLANIIISYRGLKDRTFFDKYNFSTDAILIQKDYKRLVTSSFLHVNWMHLIFNMVALYFFTGGIEGYLGVPAFLLVYFGSAIGGNLLSLYIHRFNSGYSSAGASGAIFGLIFAAIGLFPGMKIGLFLLPFSFPGWLFGLLYVAVSIYGIRSRGSNISHEAHLGGGLAGMMIALLIHPSAIVTNYITILIIAVPSIAFIMLLVYRPEVLFVDNIFKRKHMLTVEDRYNLSKKERQQQIDDILEKIHRRGMQSLSKKEKMLLEEYSNKV